MELKGVVVIITGGGTGIGRATALLFAKLGARIVVCGRRPEPLTETVRLIEQKGGDALALLTDVRDWTQVREMINRVLQRFGKIDILVNNAGIAIAKLVVETTEEEWDEMLDTNLKGVFLCSKAVLPSMVEAGSGVIVNVSSVLGKTGIAYHGAYCASKFGVIGLTQAWAQELEPIGIQIFAVCPGRTNTDMQRRTGGKKIAELSMPPKKVAAKILGLVSGKISLPSGGSMVVDEQPLRFTLYETEAEWRQVAKRWLKPVLPMLRRIKHLIK